MRNLLELLCIWNLSQGGTSKPVSFKLFSVLLDGVGFDPVQKHSGFFHHFLQPVSGQGPCEGAGGSVWMCAAWAATAPPLAVLESSQFLTF